LASPKFDVVDHRVASLGSVSVHYAGAMPKAPDSHGKPRARWPRSGASP
jgi:hypothetical protein